MAREIDRVLMVVSRKTMPLDSAWTWKVEKLRAARTIGVPSLAGWSEARGRSPRFKDESLDDQAVEMQPSRSRYGGPDCLRTALSGKREEPNPIEVGRSG